MTTKIALNRKNVARFLELQHTHALPLELTVIKEEFHGMKEILIKYEPIDEPLIGWMVDKSTSEDCL